MTDDSEVDGLDSLTAQYSLWRGIYARCGKPPRDEPVWQDGELWLRDGYPNPDWTAFVIRQSGNGFDVFQASTERRSEPVLTHLGFFARLDDAGKYVIAAIGDYLRIEKRLDPVSWSWQDQGLPAEVEEHVSSEARVTYRLRNDHEVYCVLALGDKQYSHLLLLTYDELNLLLQEGLAESGDNAVTR